MYQAFYILAIWARHSYTHILGQPQGRPGYYLYTHNLSDAQDNRTKHYISYIWLKLVSGINKFLYTFSLYFCLGHSGPLGHFGHFGHFNPLGHFGHFGHFNPLDQLYKFGPFGFFDHINPFGHFGHFCLFSPFGNLVTLVPLVN